MKRLFDILLSFIGLLFLQPFFVVIAILIKVDSAGPVFFRQRRVGKDFRRFMIYKFRTMVVDAENKGLRITSGGDSRITKMGRALRKYKIDELPQLFNVLKGDMSFVGPRPEAGGGGICQIIREGLSRDPKEKAGDHRRLFNYFPGRRGGP